MLHAGLGAIGQNARMKRATALQSGTCPCGTAKRYSKCCGVWHAGAAAPDAEKLMRSRYVAYVMKIDDYVLATWHPSTRPSAIDSAAENSGTPSFFRLDLKRHTVTGEDAAIVEFAAWFKLGGRAQSMREVSHFIHEQGRWWYVDGEVSDH